MAASRPQACPHSPIQGPLGTECMGLPQPPSRVELLMCRSDLDPPWTGDQSSGKRNDAEYMSGEELSRSLEERPPIHPGGCASHPSSSASGGRASGAGSFADRQPGRAVPSPLLHPLLKPQRQAGVARGQLGRKRQARGCVPQNNNWTACRVTASAPPGQGSACPCSLPRPASVLSRPHCPLAEEGPLLRPQRYSGPSTWRQCSRISRLRSWATIRRAASSPATSSWPCATMRSSQSEFAGWLFGACRHPWPSQGCPACML